VSTAKEEEIAEPVEHPKPEAKGKEGERIESGSTREGYPSPKYSIQVESYSQESNALSSKRRLEQEGFSPRIVQSKMALTRHNVYLGDFSTPEQAAEMGSRLQAEEIRGTLESLEDGHQSYLVGSFYTLAEAVDRALEIQRKNYPVKVSSTPVRTVYHVRIGHFGDRLQAAKMVARLRAQGHSPIVVKE
jgi:cell division protein FtsN